MNAAQTKILGLVVDVLDYELNHVADGMLLSEECGRLTRRRPIAGRALILGVGAVVVGHLADVVPPRYDVMSRSFWAQRVRRNLSTTKGRDVVPSH